MANNIAKQNTNILAANKKYNGVEMTANTQLCGVLGIELPPEEYKQDYNQSGIKVTLLPWVLIFTTTPISDNNLKVGDILKIILIAGGGYTVSDDPK